MAQAESELDPTQSAAHRFGYELRAHRRRRNLSQRELGEKVHVSGDLVAMVEKAKRYPQPDFAKRCDQALDAGGQLVRYWETVERERRVTANTPTHADNSSVGIVGPLSVLTPAFASETMVAQMMNPGEEGTDMPINRRSFIAGVASLELADRIAEMATWIETTNVGAGTLAYLDNTAMNLAHDCLTVPPAQIHEQAASLVLRIFDLLRSGRQHISQTRDLYVIAGKLCALLSWVSSDLGRLDAAEAHARNGWTLANQADHNGLRALLLSAQSKNAFWNRRYSEAAIYARRGYEFNPGGTSRVLLACQEADALQALNRIDDARKVLDLAERARETSSLPDELGGVFGCGIARQANYAVGIHLRAGSLQQALQQVDRAEMAWREGDEWAYGTWAQVQIGAALAHLMDGDLENAATTLQHILDQPKERRLATLEKRLRREIAPLLTKPAVGQSKAALMLREGIADYRIERPSNLSEPAGEEYT